MYKESVTDLYGNVYASYTEKFEKEPALIKEHMALFAQQIYSKLPRKKLVDALCCLKDSRPKFVIRQLIQEVQDLCMTEIAAKPVSAVFSEKTATYRTLTMAGYMTVGQLYEAG